MRRDARASSGGALGAAARPSRHGERQRGLVRSGGDDTCSHGAATAWKQLRRPRLQGLAKNCGGGDAAARVSTERRPRHRSSRGGLACRGTAAPGIGARPHGPAQAGGGAAAGVLRRWGGSRTGRRQPTRGAGRLRRLRAGVLRRGGGRTGLVRRAAASAPVPGDVP